eukprot:g4159.t1
MSGDIRNELLRHKNETRKRINASSNTNSNSKNQTKKYRRLGLQALKRTEMFKKCSLKMLKKLARKFKPIDFRAGEYVIKQGRVGLRFYVVLEGAIGESPRNRLIKPFFMSPSTQSKQLSLMGKEKKDAIRLPSLLLSGSFKNTPKKDFLNGTGREWEQDKMRKMQKESSVLAKPETPFVIEYFKI